MQIKRISFIFLLTFALVSVYGQPNQLWKFKDPNFPLEERVKDLVSRMTLKEKIGQMVHTSPAIERLGIPAYNWWNESLHGVARAGYATVFPQSITIAASWDKDLMLQVASAISDEARAKYNDWISRGKHGIYQGLTFWSPNINIFRDPRWGRGHETYGEDPYLTGQMGTQFVKGLQGNDPNYLKVVATAKHYAVHSGPEPLRHVFDANVSEADLRDTYLEAFRTLVKDGGVYSVMGAYNLFKGQPCCANPYLFSILRNEWGFKGYVVSDCGAITDFYTHQKTAKNAPEAAAMAVKAGTELNCGNDYPHLIEAVKQGLITEAEIDKAVERLFMARFKLGMFDPDDKVPFSKIPLSVNCSDENNYLAREAARKSIVLLKNEKNILPLSKTLKRIAIIGPNADNFETLLGNYNGIPKNPVTVLQGIKKKVEPETQVLFAEGSDLAEGIHNLVPVPGRYLQTESGQQGVTGEYFANSKLEGTPVFTRVDDQINFYWESGSPSPKLPDDNFSIRWTGYLVPPVTGTYSLGSWGMPTLEVYLDGKKILSHNSIGSAFHAEKPVDLEAGKRYKIVYQYKNWAADADAKLLWSMPQKDQLQKAVEIAKNSDAVILVLGLSQRLEGEEMRIKVDGFAGGDRTHLNLPKTQEELMEAIKKTGKPMILVLMNGSPLSINWAADNMDAIVCAGYAGQEGGEAVADVIFGDYNPAGRLPVTWYKSVDQLPPFDNYDMKGRTYRYFTGEPLYPFGFGLSLTNFSYSDLKLPKKSETGKPVSISVKVTNSGKLAGDEVVQLYLTREKSSVNSPIRQLVGFKRINLNPSESKSVNFAIDPRQLSFVNEKSLRIIEPGNYIISAGGKQPGLLSRTDTVTTNIVMGKFKLKGIPVKLEL